MRTVTSSIPAARATSWPQRRPYRASGGPPARRRRRSAAEANRDAADRGAAPQASAAASTQQRGGATTGDQGLADLVGAEVIGSSGDQIGEIDDIVISMAGADSVRAVIQAGGIAGIGEKRVALPLGQVSIQRADDGEPTVRVTMDGDALERLPEYEYEEQTTAL